MKPKKKKQKIIDPAYIDSLGELNEQRLPPQNAELDLGKSLLKTIAKESWGKDKTYRFNGINYIATVKYNNKAINNFTLNDLAKFVILLRERIGIEITFERKLYGSTETI